MKRLPGSANAKVIFALFLVHFTGDLYSSFVIPLLPVLAQSYSLSLTQVGFLTGMMRLLAFVVQPSVGYLADRYQTRLFLLGGVTLAVVFIPLMGLAQTFSLLLIFVALGSIGQSMFHPPAAGMVSVYGGNQAGLSMSLFGLGGTLAFGVGPLWATAWVARYGITALPYTMIPGLACVVLLLFLVPKPQSEGMSSRGFLGSVKEAIGPVWKPILLIWTLVVIRTYVSQSFLTFLPLFYSSQGRGLVSIGVIIAAYTVAGALSGVAAGHAADRLGYKPVFVVGYLVTTPTLFLLLYLPGQWVYFSSFLAGFFTLATMFPAISLAQALAPKGRSIVSSLMMGFAHGIGGILTPITGALADAFSIQSVLAVVAVIPLLASVMIFWLPSVGGKEAPAVTAQT